MKIELNEQQKQVLQDAVKWFNSKSSPQVFEIDGLAGTGKSVLIFHILQALGLRKDQYMPMAYTGQASIVMRTKGFPNARSIHSSLYEIIELEDSNTDISEAFGRPHKKKIFRKIPYLSGDIRLFFIDEAYMVPDYMVRDILSFKKKVIVCGDAHQLPPIGGRPAFLTNPYNCHHLTQLMRQAEDDPIVYLSQQIIKGEPIHNGTYGNSVMVIDDTDFIPEMIGYANVVITGTNKTRDMMNTYVRDLAGFSYSNLPLQGERLICRNNNWDLQQDGIALANGLNGTVISTPDILNYDGEIFHIDFKPDLVDTVFGDVLVNYDYFSGSFDLKQQYRNDYTMRKWMTGEMFEFAYAITTHLSQGSEYNDGIIIREYLRPQMQKQLDYTAITRFKRSCIIIKKTDKSLKLPEFR